MNELTTNQRSMTSREIADLVESRHDSVKRTVERLAERGTIVLPPTVETSFAGSDGRKQTVTEYRIGKRDSYIIVAQLSPEFTARLVDRWQELEAATNDPMRMLNDPAAMRGLLLTYTEKVIALEQKVVADAPKVKFAEAVKNLDGVCKLEAVAKMLGTGRNKLFKRLRDDGVLLSNNLPAQRYLDRDYFKVVEETPWTDSKGQTHPVFVTVVCGKGQVLLQHRYSNQVEA